MQRISYRADIDGLRAIAVLSVVFYHLFPKFITGGFLGVDIFFVISGFLITKIIVTDLNNSTFCFKEFYKRRIIRIFPMLIFVFSVIGVYSFFVLLPNEFNQAIKHVFHSSLFILNFKLFKEEGYFDVSSNQKPLLHLWSLSVEEQFYIFWPVALFLIHKFYKKNDHKIFFIILMTVASYIAYVFVCGQNSSKAFYYLYTRFWELSFGALISVIYLKREENPNVFKVDKRVKLFFSYVAILGLFLSLFILSESVKGFAYISFIPVLCVGFLILFHTQSFFIYKILESKILVSIGLISYPFYLVHWPVVSFFHIIDPALLTPFVKIIIFFVTLLVSAILYRFYEYPIRHSSNKKVLKILIFSMVSISIISFFVYKTDQNCFIGIKNPIIKKISDAQNDWGYPKKNIKEISIDGEKVDLLGIEGNETVLFFGDSNMSQYVPRIVYLYDQKKYDKSFVFATDNSLCPIQHIGSYYITSNLHWLRVEKICNFALAPHVKKIVISASWCGYFNNSDSFFYKDNEIHIKANLECMYSAFEKMISNFIKAGKEVFIVLGMPQGKEFDPKFFIKNRNFLGKMNIEMNHVLKENWFNSHKIIKDKMIMICKKTGAKIIDPDDHFLENDYYKAYHHDGIPIYKDSNHLNATYVEKNIKFLDFLMD
ncbi:MAG: hypothetical protein HEEMFOPI_00862 [Holosporales bacterium]